MGWSPTSSSHSMFFSGNQGQKLNVWENVVKALLSIAKNIASINGRVTNEIYLSSSNDKKFKGKTSHWCNNNNCKNIYDTKKPDVHRGAYMPKYILVALVALKQKKPIR